jgi:hypothetical protein
MIEELSATAKQVGLELIGMSGTLADNMQTWGDISDQNPESTTAKMTAGFINKSDLPTSFELTIDVQAPPDGKAVLRTWAIETRTGEVQTEYFNNIQLTFEADDEQVRGLVAKGRAITREDISRLLQSQTSQLARITVSNESSGDGTKQTHGERYDFTIAELDESTEDAVKVENALQEVLRTLKQSITDSLR